MIGAVDFSVPCCYTGRVQHSMNTRYENMAKTFMTGYNHDLFVSEHVQTAAHVLRQQVFDQYPFLWEASATEHSFLPYYLDAFEPMAAVVSTTAYQQWDEYVAAGRVPNVTSVGQYVGRCPYLFLILDQWVLSFDRFDLQESLPGWITLIVTLCDAHAIGETILVCEELVAALIRRDDGTADLTMITTILSQQVLIAMRIALEHVEIREQIPWAWQHPLIVEQFVPLFHRALTDMPQLNALADEYVTTMRAMDAALAEAGF